MSLPLKTDELGCKDCEGSGECWECSGTGHCSGCGGQGTAASTRAYCNALYWPTPATQERCDRRAPDGASERWQCEEHQRQADHLAGRAAS